MIGAYQYELWKQQKVDKPATTYSVIVFEKPYWRTGSHHRRRRPSACLAAGFQGRELIHQGRLRSDTVGPVDENTIDQAIDLLRQYRLILVMSFAPVDADGVPEIRTLAQSTDPLEIAAMKDIELIDAVIGAMSGH